MAEGLAFAGAWDVSGVYQMEEGGKREGDVLAVCLSKPHAKL